jgi:hypothetical protein
MKPMVERAGFGSPARGFEMTVSLEEVYSGGRIHTDCTIHRRITPRDEVAELIIKLRELPL